MSIFDPIKPMTFQNVSDWTVEHNKMDYISPVKRCGEMHGNRRLVDISACLEEFKRRFPLNGFDPRHFKSEKAYKAWRRKVIAAIKGASGQLVVEQERRDRCDDWSNVIEAIEPLTGMPYEAMYPHQILIPIRKLADIARQHGKRPDQITQDWLGQQRPTLGTNEWSSVQTALRQLNEFRFLSSLKPFLPSVPYSEPNAVRYNTLPGIPDHIAKEVKEWVENSTLKEFDPVEQEYTGVASEGGIGVKTSALRNFISTLAVSGKIEIARESSIADLLTTESAEIVIRAWTRNNKDKRKGSITERTAHDYMKVLFVLMGRNGVSPETIKAHLAANGFLKTGKKKSKGMSQRVRKFCEGLLGSSKQTMDFLSMHVRLRNKAQAVIDEVKASGRKMTTREVETVRAIGSAAAFCALETRGAPIRVSSALALMFRGEDITFHRPTTATKHATITLSPEHTKNDVEIWAPINPGNLNGLEVLEWYFEKIRPLYPNAEKSDFVFPGIEKDGPLPDKTFREWFKRETRAAGLPMTPHNFRHGLASLLIQKNPGRWDLLERLLDDSIVTIRRNYAWIDKRSSRKEVQHLILDLSEL